MKGLVEGRQVHYVLTGQENGLLGHVRGQHRAATVVRCWGDEPHEGYVNLLVYVDGYNDLIQTEDIARTEPVPLVWVPSVFYNEDAYLGSWHWIEPA